MQHIIAMYVFPIIIPHLKILYSDWFKERAQICCRTQKTLKRNNLHRKNKENIENFWKTLKIKTINS